MFADAKPTDDHATWWFFVPRELQLRLLIKKAKKEKGTLIKKRGKVV
jgi:hypothetical protein